MSSSSSTRRTRSQLWGSGALVSSRLEKRMDGWIILVSSGYDLVGPRPPWFPRTCVYIQLKDGAEWSVFLSVKSPHTPPLGGLFGVSVFGGQRSREPVGEVSSLAARRPRVTRIQASQLDTHTLTYLLRIEDTTSSSTCVIPSENTKVVSTGTTRHKEEQPPPLPCWFLSSVTDT